MPIRSTSASILILAAGLGLAGCPTPDVLKVPPLEPGMADPGAAADAPLPAYVTIAKGTEVDRSIPGAAAAAPPPAAPPAPQAATGDDFDVLATLPAQRLPSSFEASGNILRGSDGTLITRSGDTWRFADGSWIQRIGDIYQHSDGSATVRAGDSYFNPDGSWSRRIGNSLLRSNGQSCLIAKERVTCE